MLSMDSLVHDRCPSPDAVEFVRFCYRRRRTGWPELYDEMCAVAHRGLYRGWGNDELSAEGIGFSLFELPALAALVGRIVAEETEQRTAPVPAKVARADAVLQRAEQDDGQPPSTGGVDATDTTPATAASLRFAGANAGA